MSRAREKRWLATRNRPRGCEVKTWLEAEQLVKVGNALAEFTWGEVARGMKTGAQGVPVGLAVENPRNAYLWQFPEGKKVAEAEAWQRNEYDTYCFMGASVRAKPSRAIWKSSAR